MKFSRAFAALLLIQLALLSTLAVQYVWQKRHSPHVWVRAALHQPDAVRGRYLRLELAVDGCRSTLDNALEAQFPRNFDGTPRPDGFQIAAPEEVGYTADLKVAGGRLQAIRIQDPVQALRGLRVGAPAGAPCGALHLERPVEFYLPAGVQMPAPLGAGEELWVEVGVPKKGLPHPLQLALKENGAWKSLASE